MTKRHARAVVGCASVLMLAACDGTFASRQAVAMGADPAGASTRERVLSAVRTYADEEGIACTARKDYLLYCHRQPIEVFVLATDAGMDVCYWSRGARFEGAKFEDRMQRLAVRVDAAAGKAVTRTVPVHPECFPVEK